MFGSILIIVDRFSYVSQFIIQKESLNDKIRGDKPSMARRVEIALMLILLTQVLIEPFFLLTALIRAILTLPIAALFLIDSYIYYKDISIDVFYSLLLVAAIIFCPSLAICLLLEVCQKSKDSTSEKIRMARPPNVVDYLVKHLTTVLSIALFAFFASVVFSTSVFDLPMIATISFFSLYAIRDMGLLDVSVNESLTVLSQYAELYASAVAMLGNRVGNTLFFLQYGGFKLIMLVLHLFGIDLGGVISDKERREYNYSIIKPEEGKTYLELVLKQRLNLRSMETTNATFDEFYQLTRNLMMGTAYKFNTECSEDSLEVLERVIPLLKTKLPDDYSLRLVSDSLKALYKGYIISKLEEMIAKIDEAFSSLENTEGLSPIIASLQALELALNEDNFEKIDRILEGILVGKNSCPGKIYHAYKIALSGNSVNSGYLEDIEIKKDMDQFQAFRYIPLHLLETKGAQGSKFSEYFKSQIAQMKGMIEANSQYTYTDRHCYHDALGIYSGGHHTLSHSVAKKDNKSIASQKGIFLGFNSFYAVGEFSENTVCKYLECIDENSILELWQSKMPELSKITIEELKALYKEEAGLGQKDEKGDVWRDIIRMENENSYTENIEGHLNKYWYETLSKAVLVNELISVGYVARHENVIRPTSWTYCRQIFVELKSLVLDILNACTICASSIGHVSYNLAKVPIKVPAKAAEFSCVFTPTKNLIGQCNFRKENRYA